MIPCYLKGGSLMSFFESLSKKVSNTARTAAKKSSNLVEITKLNISIGAEEDKINKTYAEIGKLVYSQFASGKNVPEEYRTQCEAIKSCQENIKSLKNQIMALKNMKICTACGAELEIDSMFCSKCGAKQEIPSTDYSTIESDESSTGEETKQDCSDNCNCDCNEECDDSNSEQ